MERMERAVDRHSAQDAPRRVAAGPSRRAAPIAGRAARIPARLACAVALAIAALATCAAPSFAFSQRGHEFGVAFGSRVEKAEIEKGEAALGRFSDPTGVAVNEASGDVYVVDAGDQRIERFHPEAKSETGNPVSTWGFGVVDGKEELELCTTNPCAPGKPGTGAGQFDYPAKPKGHDRTAMAIAVDNSTSGSDESKGDVYVVANTVSEQNVVDKFSPTGALLGTVPIVGHAVGGVAVDASGVVWVQLGEPEALTHLETFQRFKNNASNELLSTVTLEGNTFGVEEGTELLVDCPSPGIGIDGPGSALYVNHERFQLQESPGEACLPEQEEFNQEEKNKRKAVESSVTAKTHVVSETGAQPTNDELVRANTRGIAVDQTTGAFAGNVYLDNEESIAALDSTGGFVQRFGGAQLKTGGGGGIAIDGTSQDVYVADFKKAHVDVFEPEKGGRPIINALSASDIEETKIELKALVDPHGSKLKKGYFEYGREKCPTECVKIAFAPEGIEGFGDKEVKAVIDKKVAEDLGIPLVPGTTYYYRVEAENASGLAEIATEVAPPVEPPQQIGTFTTLPNATEGLPDHRAWELVSPPKKRGASVEAIGGVGGVDPAPSAPLVQAAENGNAITYGLNASPEENPEGSRAPETQQEISKRGPGGWTSKDIVTPSTKAQGLNVGKPEEYQLFSAETLSLGLLKTFGVKGVHLQEPPLLHELNGKEVTEEERNLYLRHNFDESCEVPPKSCFEPLVTAANAPGVKGFGGELEILGATPDLAQVVLRSAVPLVKGALSEDLYEWNREKPAGEQLAVVNVLPSGEIKAGSESEPGLGIEQGNGATSDARNAISNDGKRVIWSEAGHLYTRNMETGKTLDVSLPEAEVEPIEEGRYTNPIYQAASNDGKRIFFTAAAPLTKSSTLRPHALEEEGQIAGAENPADLYVCEVVEPEGSPPECKLTDLTAGARGELGESADVAHQLPGVSEDGTYVYFVANGALAAGAVKGSCETLHHRLQLKAKPEEQCNLYEEHFNGSKWETPVVVTVLTEEDSPDWGNVDPFKARIALISSRVSPNGLFLAFMSNRQLTGKTNEDAISTETNKVFDQEVYLYEAEHEHEHKPVHPRLTCVSCNPTGAKPHGVQDVEKSGEGIGLLVDRTGSWRGKMLAGSIPSWTLTTEFLSPLYQSHYLTNEGRLFFDSPDQLVPLPSGETYAFKENVYEYEPPGLANGTCSNPSGCVALLSSGTSPEESAFLDATPDGSNVFFDTAAKLVAADQDTNYDVYDARICSEASPCIESEGVANPQGCESTKSCKGGPALTNNFEVQGPSGTGNVPKTIVRPGPVEKKSKPKPPTRAQLLAKALASCRKRYKHNKKKRASCERSAHHKYGAKKASHKAAHRAAHGRGVTR